MKKTLFFLAILLLPALTIAQDDEPQFGIKFHGFVKTDMIYDSRQSVAVREGHFHLYPLPEFLDANGEDINGQPYFNILSIQTRLKGVITGPDVLGAKTSALIEGAFFGHTDADVNGFRLRHAFAKMRWPSTELLVGQYWHAMFVTDCFPGTVSFNTGAPFQPFSRNPQVRLTQYFGDFNIHLAAMSQRDFADGGPQGANSVYLRNAVVPELNLGLQYKTDNFLIGANASFKQLLPTRSIQTATPEGTQIYKVNETVTGLSAMAYMKVTLPAITIKLEGVMGQTTQGLTMIGGYVREAQFSDYDVNDPASLINYIPVNTLSSWMDIHTNGKKWQLGLFAGFSQNQGISEKMIEGNEYDFYARGLNPLGSSIDYLYRIAPRLIYNVGKMRFAAELEYNNVAYGEPEKITDEAIVQDAEDVTSLRAIAAVYYFF